MSLIGALLQYKEKSFLFSIRVDFDKSEKFMIQFLFFIDAVAKRTVDGMKETNLEYCLRFLSMGTRQRTSPHDAAKGKFFEECRHC